MKRIKILVIIGYAICISFSILACSAARGFSTDLSYLQEKYAELKNNYEALSLQTSSTETAEDFRSSALQAICDSLGEGVTYDTILRFNTT